MKDKPKIKIDMYPLFIIFLILKLVDVIDWPWIWVCSPIWIPIAFLLFVGVMAFIASLVFADKD